MPVIFDSADDVDDPADIQQYMPSASTEDGKPSILDMK